MSKNCRYVWSFEVDYFQTCQTCLQDIQGFSDLSDTDLDSLVNDFLERHSHFAGQVYLSGYLQSIGLRIQRQRIHSMSH